MCTDLTTVPRPDRLLSKAGNPAFIRARLERIAEDITAAESKVERIRNRIERDRQALLLWQARLSAITNERRQQLC